MPRIPHHRPAGKRIRSFAKAMRREPTEAEAAMWRLLRDRRLSQFKFRRQVPFRSYILDFVCFEQRLVIEIDGSQHADAMSDRTRDEVLSSEGFEVARYWNNDVLQQRTAVLEDILAKLSERRETPHPV
ncbi:endonuclease domain-containing protein [Bradyrhizobium oligotrophicum]|uniref:endonuclease domain-containing protein n=1 Tax=Bradyrhizobium oligotrophicum TaxID=44255 RepID=UPI003EBAD490